MTNGINGQILIWSDNSDNESFTELDGFNSTGGLIVTNEDDIYVSSGYNYYEINKWTKNNNNKTFITYLWTICVDLFVSINDFVYCSMSRHNKVQIISSMSSWNMRQLVAGTGCPGITSNMLYNPQGIFVHTNLSLYVADCGNDRIQVFHYQNLSGTTVAGNGAPGTTVLNCPTDVVLDGDQNLFIVDQSNHRILRSLPSGFQCIIGCSGWGSAPNQLNTPTSMVFDSDGNIFVIDRGNNRIQKFLLLTNECGKYSSDLIDLLF